MQQNNASITEKGTEHFFDTEPPPVQKSDVSLCSVFFTCFGEPKLTTQSRLCRLMFNEKIFRLQELEGLTTYRLQCPRTERVNYVQIEMSFIHMVQQRCTLFAKYATHFICNICSKRMSNGKST